MKKNTQSVNSGKCLVPACNKQAQCLRMCNACYARTYYWHNKSLKEKMQRIEQITVWESSLEVQCGNPRAFDREKLKKEG